MSLRDEVKLLRSEDNAATRQDVTFLIYHLYCPFNFAAKPHNFQAKR